MIWCVQNLFENFKRNVQILNVITAPDNTSVGFLLQI